MARPPDAGAALHRVVDLFLLATVSTSSPLGSYELFVDDQLALPSGGNPSTT
jgi:hypothetical protein